MNTPWRADQFAEAAALTSAMHRSTTASNEKPTRCDARGNHGWMVHMPLNSQLASMLHRGPFATSRAGTRLLRSSTWTRGMACAARTLAGSWFPIFRRGGHLSQANSWSIVDPSTPCYSADVCTHCRSGLASRNTQARGRLKSGFFFVDARKPRLQLWRPWRGSLRAHRFLCSGTPTPLRAAAPHWRGGRR